MSHFTGRSDFADTCTIHYSPKEIAQATIYMGNAKVEIKDEKDLIPYYTNLVSMMNSRRGQTPVIHLASESYIDREEVEHLSWRVRDAIYTARKAKKNKQKLTVDMLAENDILKLDADKKVWKQILDVLEKHPEVIKFHLSKNFNEMSHFVEHWIVPEYFSHIHLAWQNEQRKQFLKLAADNGFYTFDKEMNPNVGLKYHPLIVDMCYKVLEYEKE